ncbi:MAG: UDP-N-acetylmuramoyl-L-alanyl-D-glutamate--2,6-diaminopimelate ligase [Patescibacteria group bacterium]
MKSLIPFFILSLYHKAFALVSAIRYGFPSKKLIVIGITGTNGKSTTVDLVHRIFVQAGFRVASASSLRFIIDGNEKKNELKMTMPGRFFMQKFLRDAVTAKCDVAILEVTSEGIRQSRHAYIDFDVAAITNITPEHIESHGSFEKYRAAKLKLFEAVAHSPKHGKAIIINGDDPSAKLFLQTQRSEAWMYALTQDKWDTLGHAVIPQSFTLHDEGIRFITHGLEFSLKLFGKFNLYNALCAVSIALSRGIATEDIRDALVGIAGVPGRLEFITSPTSSIFQVVVDYAHTPDALSNVYTTLTKKDRRLCCVLGSAGGGRDKWKRSEMGKIADEYCAEIFLTNEDPYDENPEEIIRDIAKGISKQKPNIILDRREAITAAIKKARSNDTVVITGKGAEPLMMLEDGKRIPWDDREVVRDILNKVS